MASNAPDDEVQAWVAKGSDDLLAANLIARGRGPSTVGCYLCQQAMEKLLKAMLVHLGQTVPRTHDLVDLHRRLGTDAGPFGLSAAELRGWTVYATAGRYPGFPDPQADADLQRMAACATDLLAAVRVAVGM
ncbi:MAG: HEPN domain-containing protein [Myxococcota bacterium]|nr:HEPN domain-containing protein [Myxococcota bacterium]